MKLRNTLFVFIGLLASCLGSKNKPDNSSVMVESLYTNEFVSVGVMEKLDDFIAGENSKNLNGVDTVSTFSLFLIEEDSKCYLTIMDSPKGYNRDDLTGYFEYEGNTICVYVQNAECAEIVVDLKRLTIGEIDGLLDFADTNNQITETYNSEFIMFEIISKNNLRYVPF